MTTAAKHDNSWQCISTSAKAATTNLGSDEGHQLQRGQPGFTAAKICAAWGTVEAQQRTDNR